MFESEDRAKLVSGPSFDNFDSAKIPKYFSLRFPSSRFFLFHLCLSLSSGLHYHLIRRDLSPGQLVKHGEEVNENVSRCEDTQLPEYRLATRERPRVRGISRRLPTPRQLRDEPYREGGDCVNVYTCVYVCGVYARVRV